MPDVTARVLTRVPSGPNIIQGRVRGGVSCVRREPLVFVRPNSLILSMECHVTMTMNRQPTDRSCGGSSLQ